MRDKRLSLAALVALALLVVLAWPGYRACATDGQALPEDAQATQAPRRSLADAQISAVETQTYTGKALTPKPTVTLDGATLQEDVDYTLSYRNNVEMGTAVITIKGKGDVVGARNVSFKIAKGSLAQVTIASVATQYYTGKAITPKPKVTYSGATLKLDSDYTLSYKNNTNEGTATITVTGKGIYTGTKSATFRIVKRSIADATIAKVADQTYTGKAITPRPKVTYSGTTLKVDTDYTLSYKNNTSVGTATIIATGKGVYKGSKSVTFKIVKPPAATGAKTAGALQVKDGKLVDKNGKAIQLRGVSTHGLAWFPGYVNNACFKELRNSWGANVVRLAMYTAESGGYCTGGNKSDLKKLVKNGVKYATDNDLYVIVDWHILSDGNPNTHVSDAKAFFKDISSTFKGNTNVIYEICNEPNGGTTWAQIKTYAEKVIPVIRANDPDAIILVGTPTWSQEIDKAKQNPLKYKNVMYTLHFYAATHKDELRNRLVDCVKGGLPVFVSEFGICDASGNGSIDQKSANSWVSTMKSLGVSWCMWSLCNKAESASIIKSSCTATSGFKAGDLATSGTWLLKALNGSLPAGTLATGTGGTSGSSGSSTGAKPVSFTSGNFSCSAKLTNSWTTSGGKTCYQYELSITNKGSACKTWSVAVPFNKQIAYDTGWNGTFSASGSKLTIKNASYNGSIAKGATLTGIGFQVTAASGLAVKP